MQPIAYQHIIFFKQLNDVRYKFEVKVGQIKVLSCKLFQKFQIFDLTNESLSLRVVLQQPYLLSFPGFMAVPAARVCVLNKFSKVQNIKKIETKIKKMNAKVNHLKF